jgi:DNA-binding transcriptional ArsR family regulator
MAVDAQPELAAVDIHDVLSNERRRMVLSILRDENGHTTARELSERIAELETGQTPPPRNIRQSAYVSLHQTHLPKLDNLGIVDYDESTKTVSLTDRARRVSVYMETVPRYGLSWVSL